MSADRADDAADARAVVLGRIADALTGVTEPEAPPRAYRRTTDVAAGSAAALDLLADRLLDYRAAVLRCTEADLPAVVAAQLADAGSVVVPADLPVAWLDAVPATGTAIRTDAPAAPLTHAELDATGAVLTACRVAVAETGTIMLDGAPDQGRRAITLLPDRHVVVVRADQVVGGVPEAVAILGEHPERPLTWISGPSATSDIELVRVEGVHGPRDLRVVLVG